MDDMTANDPLTLQAPALTAEDCMDVAARHFGIEAEQTRLLSGERDLNLLVRSRDGRQFVIKISNAAESPDVTKFQTEALCHVEKHAAQIPVPHIVRAIDGASEARITLSDGREHTVRALSFLQGLPLHRAPHSTAQRRNLAGCLAQLDIALMTYRPAITQEDLSWNITNLLRLEPLLAYQDEDKQQVVSNVMKAFQREVVPALQSLRKQVIYNDLNFYNVLVDEEDNDVIAGIIDFGDIVYAPLINDLAVACSYQFSGNKEPLAAVGEFVAAYHEVLPLLPNEVDFLPTLIAARFATTVLITGWRAQRYPHNKDYILRNNPSAWEGLHFLAGKSEQQLKSWAHSCCRMEVSK